MTKKHDKKNNTEAAQQYAPDIRNYMEGAPSVEGLPNPAEDPIVCNNIVNQEFDYTYDGESIEEDS